MQFRTIKLGSHGALVETWQARLLVDGAPLTVDGAFGPATAAATKTWQLAHGLTPDGVVGHQTWALAGFETEDAVRVAPNVVVADMSHYQDVFDLACVAQTCALVALKATQGLSYVDPTFRDRIAGLRVAGCPRIAAYHYLTGVDGVEQARHFVDTLAGVGAEGIIPVLDFESAPDGEAHAASCTRALEWVTHVEDALHRPVLVYTYTSFLRTFRDSAAGLSLATRALWVARYRGDKDPGDVAPWSAWTLHQFTPHGSLPGIANHVDLSRSVALDVLDARVGAVK